MIASVPEIADWIDAALRLEASPYRADAERERLGSDLDFYGASVGIVRGTVRDAGRRYPGLSHDEVTALSSELWRRPVFERRLAAVVLLQSHAAELIGTDLTRIEGFVREGRMPELVDLLAVDVVGPMLRALDRRGRARAELVLDRWARDPDVWVRRGAVLAPLRELKSGARDVDRDRVERRLRSAQDAASVVDPVLQDAVARVRAAME
ncbi:DNA alkylation repair protein [Leifsonia flava]|uniref:DNA alkylation repair protein n=1 Tax=Orlajensenia leifsoniae TaxID=2561933 RepID=UPI001EFFD370|nr:DNA alkylation repair protein [Leifsonia flava]